LLVDPQGQECNRYRSPSAQLTCIVGIFYFQAELARRDPAADRGQKIQDNRQPVHKSWVADARGPVE
jgi:hypothetical protein